MKKIVPEDAVLIPENAQRVFQGVIYDVYQWPQKLFDGTDATFEMLRRADTVGALCIVDDKILVLNDEQPHRGARLGFPGGRVDPGEDIAHAVRREIAEETGYEFKNWRLIKVWQPHTKVEWFIYYYIAWDVSTKGEPHLDAGEKIAVQEKTFEETKQLTARKAGYMGEAAGLFEAARNVDDLLSLPEFVGKEIDRS
jgi:ADP-ribose pyrophosphatase